MTKITIDEDCGNSPKKQFIKEFNIAFAKGDMDYVLDCFSEDIRWEVINHSPVVGREKASDMLKTMAEPAEELVIDNIVSHGNRCAANGTLRYADGVVAFCDIYTFTSHAKDAKIRSLIGYAINVKK